MREDKESAVPDSDTEAPVTRTESKQFSSDSKYFLTIMISLYEIIMKNEKKTRHVFFCLKLGTLAIPMFFFFSLFTALKQHCKIVRSGTFHFIQEIKHSFHLKYLFITEQLQYS